MATSGKPLTLDVGRLAHPSPPPRRRPDHELRNAANATTSANGRCRQLGDRFGHHWLVSLLHDAHATSTVQLPRPTRTREKSKHRLSGISGNIRVKHQPTPTCPASTPLGYAGRRVAFVSQLEARAFLVVLDHGARRRCSVEMPDERAAAGAVRWWRRIHGRRVAPAYHALSALLGCVRARTGVFHLLTEASRPTGRGLVPRFRKAQPRTGRHQARRGAAHLVSVPRFAVPRAFAAPTPHQASVLRWSPLQGRAAGEVETDTPIARCPAPMRERLTPSRGWNPATVGVAAALARPATAASAAGPTTRQRHRAPPARV